MVKTASKSKVITLKVQNEDAEIKRQCYDCSYLNPKATGTYKCHVKGSCPAVPLDKDNFQGLSKESHRLVLAFDRAAQAYGWEIDQGSPNSSAKARGRYERAKRELSVHIRELEDSLDGVSEKD